MRLTILIILLITSLLFSACSPKCEPKIETVFVKSKVPRLTTLHKLKPYALSTVKVLNDENYSVKKKDLETASAIGKKRIKIISFYEDQNMRFNREFSGE